MIREESWGDKKIRFYEIEKEWLADAEDICDAFNVSIGDLNPSSVGEYDSDEYGHLLLVDEVGIYECLLSLDTEETRKFQRWGGTVMQKLRRLAGLEGYEAFRMTDEETQDAIDDYLNNLFYDEKRGLMLSVTVAGGDVEQVPINEVEV